MMRQCLLLLSLLLLLLLLRKTDPVTSQSQQLSRSTPLATETPSFRNANSFGSPLVRHDGRFAACAGRNLFGFERNGTVGWIVPLHYACRGDITPVSDDTGKMYLVAEDRVLKITPSHVGSSRSAVAVLFGEDSSIGPSGKIIGLSVSSLYSSVLITVRNRGLFALSLNGQLLWVAGPLLYRFGYRLGCRENITDCYFNSAPVVDQCEGTVYVANTEGQIYSLYIRSPQFRWIQDFSSVDKSLEIVPGNNGHLYVMSRRRSIILSLDVSSGNISWQNSVGPISPGNSLPVVDSNGWLSIGSLDGFLYSISPSGDVMKFLEAAATDAVIQVSPVLDCSGLGVYMSQTIMEGKFVHSNGDHTFISALKPINFVFTLLTPATGTVYWTEKYEGEPSSLLSKSDIRFFELDERILLTLLAAGRAGKNLGCYTTRQKIAWTCSQANLKSVGFAASNEKSLLLFMFLDFVVLVILGVAVRFCCIFWRKKKLQDHGLGRFLEKRRSLHNKRKAFRKVILDLEQKASEDDTNNGALDQLREAIRAKEGVERKLTTSYSLGSDRIVSRDDSILPMYDGKSKSHSFHSARRESVTIFNTYSSTSSEEEEEEDDDGNSSSCYSDAGTSGSSSNGGEIDTLKSTRICEAGCSSRAMAADGCHGESPPRTAAASSRVFTNPMFAEQQTEGAAKPGSQELVIMQDVDSRRTWLKRRRTLSSTN